MRLARDCKALPQTLFLLAKRFRGKWTACDYAVHFRPSPAPQRGAIPQPGAQP